MSNLAVFDSAKIASYVQSDIQFPVPFEGLWQLCGYSRKDNALRHLKGDLVNGLDFSSEMRESNGGRASEVYHLTNDAAKIFAIRARTDEGIAIARLFVAAFDEMRNQLANQPRDFYGLMHHALDQMQAIEKQQQEHELRLDGIDSELERIKNPDGYFFTVLGYCNNNGIRDLDRKTAAAIGRKVSRYCEDNNLKTHKVYDARFGEVKTYPVEALEAVLGDRLDE